MGESKQNVSDTLLELSLASADKALVLQGCNQKWNDFNEKKTSNSCPKTKKSPFKNVKIKIVVPKGFLKNLDMDSFRIQHSETILNSIVNNSPSGTSLKGIAEETRRHILEDRQTVVPIMGKSALLAKHNKWSKDAEIVTKIVMDKFKKSLGHCKQRTTNNRKMIEDDRNRQDDNNQTNLEINEVLAEYTNNHLVNIDSLERNAMVEEESYQQCHTINNQLNEARLESYSYIDDRSSKEEIAPGLTFCRPKMDEQSNYDEEKFLENALGEEICRYNVAESCQQNETTTSDFECTEEASSVSTTQISYLVSKASSVYSQFSKKLHQHRNIHTSSPVLDERFDLGENPVDEKATVLMNEAAIQHQIIVQTCKALNICLSSKEFRCSTEYLEAERILLLAMLKRDAIRKELIRVDYECLEDEEIKYLGRVTISNLVFPAEHETNPSGESSRWFLAIAECNTTVLATKIVAASEDGNIRFKETFDFEKLDSDFQITVSIYSLNMKNCGKTMSHESKFHIKEETTKCPTPNKIFQKSSSTYRRHYSYERRDPSFVLWNTTTIRIADLNKPVPFHLTRIEAQSTLNGTMIANISSKVEITGTNCGFLTIGSATGGCASWNRRWCYLQGHTLSYWNYPTEQEISDPIGVIDLSYSVTSSISQVDRELCARPRTLLVETGRVSRPQDKEDSLVVFCNSSYTITKHYLQADNYEEMIIWKNVLNSVVSALRNWNCMMCEIFFYKSK